METRQLREWLNSDTAELLRKVIAANIAVLQAEAGAALIESIEKQNQEIQFAQDRAQAAVEYVHTLAVLQRFREQDASLIQVLLKPD